MSRNIFAELTEGFDALAQSRAGKLTLRTHTPQLPALEAVDGAQLIALREDFKMSRPVFAMYLRVNARTLENWEQGRAKPNAQATTLIRLLQKYPGTLEQLATLA